MLLIKNAIGQSSTSCSLGHFLEITDYYLSACAKNMRCHFISVFRLEAALNILIMSEREVRILKFGTLLSLYDQLKVCPEASSMCESVI